MKKLPLIKPAGYMTNYTAIAPTTNSTLAKTLHQRNHKEDP